ncbi:MAG TPA: hypothetical protein VGM34_02940 [Chlamydiales bacterium]
MSTLSLGTVGLGAGAVVAGAGAVLSFGFGAMCALCACTLIAYKIAPLHPKLAVLSEDRFSKLYKEHPLLVAAPYAIVSVGMTIAAYSFGTIAFSIGKAVWFATAVPSLSKPLMMAAGGFFLAAFSLMKIDINTKNHDS